MKTTIKGLRKVDYYSSKIDKQVSGVSFYVERRDPEVVGMMVEEVFMKDESLGNLGIAVPSEKFKELLGKTLDIEYNRRGFVVGLAII